MKTKKEKELIRESIYKFIDETCDKASKARKYYDKVFDDYDKACKDKDKDKDKDKALKALDKALDDNGVLYKVLEDYKEAIDALGKDTDDKTKK